MEGWTKIIPQTWDADTPQVAMDAVQNDPEGDGVIFVEDEPERVPQAGVVVPQVEQQAYERPVPPIQRPVMREGQGSLIVRIKARVSTPIMDTMKGNEWPGSTTEPAAPVQGTVTNEQSSEGLLNVQEKEPQSQNLQASSDDWPRPEEEKPCKATLVEMTVEEDIRATQPLEAAAKTLAAVLQKECGIMPIPSVDAPRVSASTSAAAPIPRELSTQPEIGTGGSPRQAQTDKVVTIAETLLNELITWKEMIDEGRTAEQQVPELC
jgi:hypothetical protein